MNKVKSQYKIVMLYGRISPPPGHVGVRSTWGPAVSAPPVAHATATKEDLGR